MTLWAVPRQLLGIVRPRTKDQNPPFTTLHGFTIKSRYLLNDVRLLQAFVQLLTGVFQVDRRHGQLWANKSDAPAELNRATQSNVMALTRPICLFAIA